jgi:hypothetical protein
MFEAVGPVIDYVLPDDLERTMSGDDAEREEDLHGGHRYKICNVV